MGTRSWRCRLGGAAVVLLAGCAGGPSPSGVQPADLPALAAEAQRNPTDAGLLSRLGIAYYNNRQYDRARDALRASLALRRPNFPARVYLGLCYEQLGRLDSARVSYTAAGAEARTDAQRGQIENRLSLLTRAELRQAARQAVAFESEVSRQPPDPNRVAVSPFHYVGTNDSLRPLARGLTQLVVSDLSKVSKLQLLERERVQALNDELKLSETGRVDSTTGARTGRLLRAGRVVQGSLQDLPTTNEQLKIDADVVNSSDTSVLASGSGTDRLQLFFSLEKNVVFQLLDRLHVPLTPAERRALTERPTADLQAFLAFSRGLEAEDRGDLAGAEAAYDAALKRDPNFRAAKEHRDNTRRSQDALTSTASALAGLGPGGGYPEGGGEGVQAGQAAVLRQQLSVIVPTVGSGLSSRVGIGSPGPITTPPSARPPLPEAFGSDNPGTNLTGTIIIIITRP